MSALTKNKMNLDMQDKIGFGVIGTAKGLFVMDKLQGINTILTTVSLLIAIGCGIFMLIKHSRDFWKKK